MNNFIKYIFLLAIVLSVSAQSSFTVMPYHVPIKYNDSGVRENSSLTGIYSAWQIDFNNTFEFAVDYSDLNYMYGFQLDQYDYTFVYNNESIPEWKFRAGAHYIVSDDGLTDKSFVIFGGIGKYRYRSWNAMINVYYSNYANYTPSLNVIQFSPNFGLNFMLDRTQGICLNSQINYIVLNDTVQSDKKNYFSLRETLTYFNSNLSISAYALFGEQKFAVRQDGFLVYNVADLMKNGLGASITYSFTQSFFLKAGVECDKFDEEAYGTSATSTKFLLLAGFNF